MHLSKLTLKGFSKLSPPSAGDPVPWEAVLLAAAALLSLGSQEAAEVAAFALICFDSYARPSEVLTLVQKQLLPPARVGPAAVKMWAIVFAPSTLGRFTKAGTQDDTIRVGATAPDRRWIDAVVRALYHRCTGPLSNVFNVTLADAERIWAKGMKLACIAGVPNNPHALRHGGPSHDMLYHAIDGLAAQQRGHWLTINSVLRYQKAGKLLRQRAQLSDKQLTDATHEVDFLKAEFP